MSGIYIHIPFCARQCTYCDFHFSTTYAPYRSRMLDALVRELEMRAADWQTEPVETLYFGGGTPSLLSGEEVGRLIRKIRESYPTPDIAEITLECNPDDCSSGNLAAWRAAGVNRLSIGLQSFTDAQLEWMNRTHSASGGIEAVKRARAAGFDNLTVDLMYGLPDLSPEMWKQQLHQVIALGVGHISAYCLTVEERTPLAAWTKAGTIHPSDADQQSAQFEILVSTLGDAGFEQYEISNFARNGAFSRHNSAYWLGRKFVAIGPSAHGFDGTNRYWNVANNPVYMQRIEAGELPQTVEKLTPNDRFNELLLVGLRTKWGVEKNCLFAQRMPGEKWYAALESWKVSGKLTETATHLFLTQEGRLLADAIASDLFVVD